MYVGDKWINHFSLSEMDQIKIGPHGKHQLSNKKESSRSVHPVKSSEVTNIKILSNSLPPFLTEVG